MEAPDFKISRFLSWLLLIGLVATVVAHRVGLFPEKSLATAFHSQADRQSADAARVRTEPFGVRDASFDTDGNDASRADRNAETDGAGTPRRPDAEASAVSSILLLFSDASPQTRLSVLMSLLLFGVAAMTIRNARLQELVIGLFRDRLRAEQIYRIFRTIIVFVFVLLVMATLLIGFGPMLDHYLVGRQTNAISEALDRRDRELSSDPAMRAMQLQNYPRSRQLYMARLGMAHDEQSIDQIRGYITATYYGQGLHREGLSFICSYYRRFARGDYRYLFNIHAHIRKIALQEGRAVAADVARQFREKCGRPDYSEVWAAMPLGVMETVHDGHSKTEAPGTFDPADLAFLSALLARPGWQDHLDAPAVQMYPFALYMVDRYEDALRLFDRPNALLHELTLYDAGSRSDDADDQIRFLGRFTRDYPKSSYAALAYRQLAVAYQRVGNIDAAYESIRRVQEEDRDDVMQELTAEDMEKADTLIKDAKFAEAKAYIGSARALLQKHGLHQDDIDQLYQKVTKADRWARAVSPTQRFRAALLLRDELEWRRPANAYLRNNLRTIAVSPPAYSRALYILAANQRREGDYDDSYETLNKFLADVPRSDPLYDDVLAEIGYYHFVLQDDIPAAKAAFERVVAGFKDRNAYDDALWWLGKIALQERRYPAAAARFATISAIQGTNFAERAASGFRKANNRANFHAFSGASIAMEDSDFGRSVTVRRVQPATRAWRLGFRVGDEIVSLCGKMVGNLDDDADGITSLVDDIDLTQGCRIGIDRAGQPMHAVYRL